MKHLALIIFLSTTAPAMAELPTYHDVYDASGHVIASHWTCETKQCRKDWPYLRHHRRPADGTKGE
jgi:hypothetical protein